MSTPYGAFVTYSDLCDSDQVTPLPEVPRGLKGATITPDLHAVWYTFCAALSRAPLFSNQSYLLSHFCPVHPSGYLCLRCSCGRHLNSLGKYITRVDGCSCHGVASRLGRVVKDPFYKNGRFELVIPHDDVLITDTSIYGLPKFYVGKHSLPFGVTISAWSRIISAAHYVATHEWCHNTSDPQTVFSKMFGMPIVSVVHLAWSIAAMTLYSKILLVTYNPIAEEVVASGLRPCGTSMLICDDRGMALPVQTIPVPVCSIKGELITTLKFPADSLRGVTRVLSEVKLVQLEPGVVDYSCLVDPMHPSGFGLYYRYGVAILRSLLLRVPFELVSNFVGAPASCELEAVVGVLSLLFKRPFCTSYKSKESLNLKRQLISRRIGTNMTVPGFPKSVLNYTLLVSRSLALYRLACRYYPEFVMFPVHQVVRAIFIEFKSMVEVYNSHNFATYCASCHCSDAIMSTVVCQCASTYFRSQLVAVPWPLLVNKLSKPSTILSSRSDQLNYDYVGLKSCEVFVLNALRPLFVLCVMNCGALSTLETFITSPVSHHVVKFCAEMRQAQAASTLVFTDCFCVSPTLTHGGFVCSQHAFPVGVESHTSGFIDTQLEVLVRRAVDVLRAPYWYHPLTDSRSWSYSRVVLDDVLHLHPSSY